MKHLTTKLIQMTFDILMNLITYNSDNDEYMLLIMIVEQLVVLNGITVQLTVIRLTD